MSTPRPALDLTGVLKDAPIGEWLALSRDRTKIVGTGKTLEEALKIAHHAGETDPIVMKVPPVSALIL
jgi:hypothetical protein